MRGLTRTLKLTKPQSLRSFGASQLNASRWTDTNIRGSRMHLEREASIVFWFISDVEYSLGVISLADIQDRAEVYAWLLDPGAGGASVDPRDGESPGESNESPPQDESTETATPAIPSSGTGGKAEDPPLQFLPAGLRSRWCFTKNDADFYPSVPHGHLNDKNNSWPKLNPYTGRAYAAKEKEKSSLRLTRDEMISLWNNQHFRKHALETIAWYSETYPRYHFPVPKPFHLPKWRRR